ncbi:Hypothetical predicted protein [Podarcis lilfordi]|uniref:Uncharacterized protein n=1 Tax=Podarcis lilfordi TaxID=74358 RepID=A0AA35PHK7_9SAUR|nr:Hypothetical predicted protein [Podarcis lilfordi]
MAYLPQHAGQAAAGAPGSGRLFLAFFLPLPPRPFSGAFLAGRFRQPEERTFHARRGSGSDPGAFARTCVWQHAQGRSPESQGCLGCCEPSAGSFGWSGAAGRSQGSLRLEHAAQHHMKLGWRQHHKKNLRAQGTYGENILSFIHIYLWKVNMPKIDALLQYDNRVFKCCNVRWGLLSGGEM